MKKVFKWIGLAFAGLFILGLVVELTKTPEQRALEKVERESRQAESRAKSETISAEKHAQELAAKAKELEALPLVTALELAKDYEENTVAADQKYKQRKFKVSGKVTDISTDILGNPYITMGGQNEFMQPQFSFDKNASGQLAKLKKGAKLTLQCEGKGDIAKIPMSDNCEILS